MVKNLACPAYLTTAVLRAIKLKHSWVEANPTTIFKVSFSCNI